MKFRRVPPLAIAFALMAAALVATTWATRRTVVDAFALVRDGQALAALEAVRADLADLGGPPDQAALDELLHTHDGEGLRYVATLDSHGKVSAQAGRSVGRGPGRARTGVEISHVDGRVRIEARASFRRAWGVGGKPWWIVLEIDPVEADELAEAASRALWIGSAAALTLLGVAIALVRRALSRAAEASARERERRLASLGEMSAVLAHEIRNPLASLKGNAQLLAAMLPDGPDGAKARTKATRVVDEAIRLETLTGDLLKFVRTGELHRELVDPGELLRAAAGDGEIEIACDAPAWSVDRARMTEVLVNLIANARHAGPPVRASATTSGDRLVIEVADHGPGVPAAKRDQIFEPFVTDKEHGTGLGLAIARRIVELHRGTIAVADGPSGGAVFRIEIPKA